MSLSRAMKSAWSIDKAVDKTHATLDWTVTKTDCATRSSGDKLRVAVRFEGDDQHRIPLGGVVRPRASRYPRAARRPSSADDTIPPAYPAPSPIGNTPLHTGGLLQLVAAKLHWGGRARLWRDQHLFPDESWDFGIKRSKCVRQRVMQTRGNS